MTEDRKRELSEERILICGTYGGWGISREAFLRLRELGQEDALREPDIGELYSDGSGPRKSFSNLESFGRDIPRNDPLLLQVWDEMGDSMSASLCKIVEVKVPVGVEWDIEEYDGNEWVAEKHRTWP